MPDNDNSNVVVLDIQTTLPIPPDQILKSAIGKLDEVVLIGFDKDGEFYFAASESGAKDILWLIKKAENFLINHAELKDA